MRTLRTRILLTAALLASLAVALSGQGRKVSGTVVDASSERAVVAAEVQYEEGGTLQTTTTDEKGYFEFKQGRLGVVTVRKRGYGTAYARWPAESSSLRIRMRPPLTVNGTVIDMATRRALDRAVVNVIVRSVDGNILSDTVSASRGVFTFDDLPTAAGQVVYLARADGYAPRFGTFTMRDKGATSLQIGLLLDAMVEGTVVDGDGEAVEGALITSAYRESMDGGGLLASLIGGNLSSDADGAFQLSSVVPDSTLSLQAIDADGNRSNIVTVSVGPGMVQSGVVLRIG